MKLFVQPEDGVLPLLDAINRAKSRIEIAIFRFDRLEIEKALAAAVSRGVFVHALIAYTNRGGEKELRKLEMRLLAAGVTVARTADDFVRYHGKFVIIDRRELHILAYNFTHLDIDHSRSFGIVTRNDKVVQEAARLFEADATRQTYTACLPTFVVSPANARKQLAALIRSARKELLIYDPEVGDPSMIQLLEERAAAGVAVKVIGRVTRKVSKVEQHKLSKLRLHARCIVRDGRQAFIGSQSLREVELGSRREVGIIFREAKIIARLIKTFQQDWEAAQQSAAHAAADDAAPATKVAKKVAKAVTRDLPPIGPVLQVVVKEIVGPRAGDGLDTQQVEDSVKDAVKEAVKDAVLDAVEDAVLQDGIARGK
ncbi:MAG TPA: phospholipase D-like domain-containing protein [Bryobacteraceae bacterium]|nr:phospholipase D-like domain-containing protein [Bryobacteraceae bacterium]